MSIKSDARGNIYAAGYFTNGNASGTGYKYVAKWNGTTRAELGTGTNTFHSNYSIDCLAVDATGNIYAAGDYIAKWDGTRWTQLGMGANALKIK